MLHGKPPSAYVGGGLLLKTLTKTIYTSKEEHDIAHLIETDDWLNKIG